MHCRLRGYEYENGMVSDCSGCLPQLQVATAALQAPAGYLLKSEIEIIR